MYASPMVSALKGSLMSHVITSMLTLILTITFNIVTNKIVEPNTEISTLTPDSRNHINIVVSVCFLVNEMIKCFTLY